jgi:murein DD-endopeptidase MepM/ murein hydrolase activator NlpD
LSPAVRRGRHSCKLRAELKPNLLSESNPLSSQISRSVGRWEKGASNLQPDVEVVQRLLEAAAQALQAPELDPKGVDGKIARPPATSNTVAAIEAFQSRFTSSVDGLIKPDSQTWHALLDAAGEKPAVQEPPNQSDVSSNAREFSFPFPILPAADWLRSPRAFASNRNNGLRAHAGCDLYFEKGTWIHAIGDGIVIRGPYPFYCQTFALEVDHGDFLARYGEIQAKTTVKQGDKVRAGEQIARVGHLVGIQVPSDMLHLELYDKSASGLLTITDAARSKKRSDGISFMRRKDLIDPTPRLNQWRGQLPQA